MFGEWWKSSKKFCIRSWPHPHTFANVERYILWRRSACVWMESRTRKTQCQCREGRLESNSRPRGVILFYVIHSSFRECSGQTPSELFIRNFCVMTAIEIWKRMQIGVCVCANGANPNQNMHRERAGHDLRLFIAFGAIVLLRHKPERTQNTFWQMNTIYKIIVSLYIGVVCVSNLAGARAPHHHLLSHISLVWNNHKSSERLFI